MVFQSGMVFVCICLADLPVGADTCNYDFIL